MRFFIGCVLFLGLAVPQAQEIEGGYVGVSLGSFDYTDDGEIFGIPFADSATSYRVLGGYQFNDYYAVEATVGATSDVKESFRAVDPFFGNVSLDIKGQYEIATVRVLAFAPLTSMSVFGGIGYYDATLDLSLAYQDAFDSITLSEESSQDGATILGGVQFEMRRFAIRGEYEWFDTDGGVDVYNLSATVVFRF